MIERACKKIAEKYFFPDKNSEMYGSIRKNNYFLLKSMLYNDSLSERNQSIRYEFYKQECRLLLKNKKIFAHYTSHYCVPRSSILFIFSYLLAVNQLENFELYLELRNYLGFKTNIHQRYVSMLKTEFIRIGKCIKEHNLIYNIQQFLEG